MEIHPVLERHVTQECNECGSTDIVESWQDGTATCRGCGLVVQEKMLDVNVEYRTFSDDTGVDPNRVGPAKNPLLNSEQQTNIGMTVKKRKSQNSQGQSKIPSKDTERNKQISKHDKIMNKCINDINDYALRLSLNSNISNRAKEMFHQYCDHIGQHRGSTSDTSGSPNVEWAISNTEIMDIVSASLFIACRTNSAARTFKEISGVTKVRVKRVGSVVRKMEAALKVKKVQQPKMMEYAPRYCNALDLPRTLAKAVGTMAQSMKSLKGWEAKTPPSLLATSIYIVCSHLGETFTRTFEQISSVTGAAIRTIQRTNLEVQPFLKNIMPSSLTVPDIASP